MEKTLHYRSDIQEISQIRKDLEFTGKEWSIPESDIRQILVIIEELFSNIVRYAFDDSQEHLIEIRLVNNGNQIDIEMIDDGIDFNPLQYQKRPKSDPVISTSDGMGLTLIKAFSSNISYRRISGNNHMYITKKLRKT